jgi:hypothetical protein
VQAVFDQHRAQELIRKIQQGAGKPVISTNFNDHQVVAVGNTLHFSKGWKAFPDFLSDYIKNKLDPAWGQAEIAKTLSDRHPIMQWYDAYCRYQKAQIKRTGEINNSVITGVVACYLGLAYALYLLAHNVKLQERLIKRLKNTGNFQGAYYEMMVASILVRAGFTLTLEDESDGSTKHCEFAAVSPKTGKRYWVEAKMRAVRGMLGHTMADGGADNDALARLIPHLNNALGKPASDDRLIFIDLNAPPVFTNDGQPDWLEPAMTRLEKYEKKDLKPGIKAYVFVTNIAFHRQLDRIPSMVAAPFGLGFPDFNRPGMIRVIDAYKQKQKHIDAHVIGQSLSNYLRFPSTFDGQLPSQVFGNGQRRILIGQTYCFEGIDGRDLVGTVTAATVNEQQNEAIIAVTEEGGVQSHLLSYPMTDDEMAECKEYGPAYFGDPKEPSKTLKTQFELFEWLMEANKLTTRSMILEWFGARANLPDLAAMDDDELRMTYCEALVWVSEEKNKTAPASIA